MKGLGVVAMEARNISQKSVLEKSKSIFERRQKISKTEYTKSAQMSLLSGPSGFHENRATWPQRGLSAADPRDPAT